MRRGVKVFYPYKEDRIIFTDADIVIGEREREREREREGDPSPPPPL